MFGAKVWEEKVIIPTYGIGEPDKNPMFLEKRVYQGSSGKVYPYPTIDKIYDEKEDKEYTAVFLENEYLKVMVLPELGGRIQRAYDKTNGYDFVYYNQVIKPALVGLTGPWISGGIEFNWPQHHRPSTFLPTDFTLKTYEDGSCSVQLNDVDRINGTKGIAEIKLYPGKAYIEINGQLYNRTPMPQTFLWWANPAVAVNDNTQSVFPPDVHAVMDHGKRDVSKFPIATGVYYKHDYGKGVDISRYKNIPVPTSYMAAKSEYDFVGGYDYGKEAGILHVADHHISPGKKQWTWGNGDFGQAWDRNLTDEDGPYIELMTGVYTDNQPDFTWLKPFEEKTFTQYFMPYKGIGYVKNASTKAAVNLEVEDGKARVRAYATSEYEDTTIELFYNGQQLLCEKVKLSPVDVFDKIVGLDAIDGEIKEENFRLNVVAKTGEVLVAYAPEKKKIEEIPEPAEAAKAPEEIMTNEELFLTALHIEQYRHATYLPEDYYLEGLKRDSKDIRICNAYGCLLMRRGNFAEAEGYLRRALERLTWKNPNPYDSEPYYNLGLALFYQGKDKEAFDNFYKATWSAEQQEMSFYYMAAIAAKMQKFDLAFEFVGKSLVRNVHNIKARGLKAAILRKLGRKEEAAAQIKENLKLDAFDYVSRFEASMYGRELDGTGCASGEGAITELLKLTCGREEAILQMARDYGEAGLYEEAIEVLTLCKETKPLIKYYEGYYLAKLGRDAEALLAMQGAEKIAPDYTFPNKLEDILVLETAIGINPQGAKAYYYLGNLFYDKRQYAKSKELWEKSVELDSEYATVHRNLALVYFNKYDKKEEAVKQMEIAFNLNKTDARIFMELDQIYKKMGMTYKERLNGIYSDYPEVVEMRDDLCVEYATLLNMSGKNKEALDFIMAHKFHPWEGGEGKVTAQYTVALTELAKTCIKAKDYTAAIEYLERALVYPDNLGEGKLEGTKDNNIYYYLGVALEAIGENDKAKACFENALEGTDSPAGMMYYNDQPADMILYQGMALEKLGDEDRAGVRFNKLLDYGERHIFDEVKIEYFAVSLPDLQIFEEDLTQKNVAHCRFLMGLGNYGLGNYKEAIENFELAFKIDANHQKCKMFLEMAKEQINK